MNQPPAWRSDSLSLAAACGDGQVILYDPATARLWDETGKQISLLKNCDTAAFRVAFTSTQHPLVGDWSGAVREWTAEGQEVRSLSARLTN